MTKNLVQSHLAMKGKRMNRRYLSPEDSFALSGHFEPVSSIDET